MGLEKLHYKFRRDDILLARRSLLATKQFSDRAARFLKYSFCMGELPPLQGNVVPMGLEKLHYQSRRDDILLARR
jgi:hypothetical protein